MTARFLNLDRNGACIPLFRAPHKASGYDVRQTIEEIKRIISLGVEEFFHKKYMDINKIILDYAYSKAYTLRKMKYILFVFSFLLLLSGCEQHNPQRIVDGSIDAHGGKLFENVHIEFDFRNRHYTSHRNGGTFTYTRQFKDSTGSVRDVFSNEGFYREINGSRATITEERAKAFSNSVNSVIYFALLPYGLNDPAVEKTYVEQTEINGKQYDVIKVTFEKEGGGKDYEDVFLYWIDQESKKVDYLAYTYESDGGGIRFREAINSRIIEGILFQDYVNYEPADKNVPLDDMENLFKNGQLKKLSDIVLENISVRFL